MDLSTLLSFLSTFSFRPEYFSQFLTTLRSCREDFMLNTVAIKLSAYEAFFIESDRLPRVMPLMFASV